MTLAEVREMCRHAKVCGLKAEYQHTGIFEWQLVINDKVFSTKKMAHKYIEQYIEANFFKGTP